MLRKLRLKFILINMAIVLSVLLAMFAMVYGITKRDLEAESLEMMRTAASEPFQMVRPGEHDSDVRFAYFVVQLDSRGLPQSAVGYFDLTDREYILSVVNAAMERGDETGTLEDQGLRYYFGSNILGRCVVFADMSGERATLSSLLNTCLTIGGVSLAAFLLISIFLARWAVRPVERAWEQQRQFVADASHELKTPLTVILTNAELLTSPSVAEEDRAQYAESILTMSRQMRGLVGGLLDLARVEDGGGAAGAEKLDLSALIEDASLPFEPLCFERGLTLQTISAPGIFINGNPQRIREVADILLDNALKYSSVPGTVTVQLTAQGRRARLSVSSPGEAMSPEELKDIFKRFYRADKARSMNESYGLGLAIAEGIVSSHKGRIWAESRDGYNTFIVELPIA